MAVKTRRKAAPSTLGKPSRSTSDVRANFANALKMTDRHKLITGFFRYNSPVAALVPIEAVRVLAGGSVDPTDKARIVRLSKMFIDALDSADAAPARRRHSSKPRAKKAAPKKKTAARKAKSRRPRR